MVTGGSDDVQCDWCPLFCVCVINWFLFSSALCVCVSLCAYCLPGTCQCLVQTFGASTLGLEWCPAALVNSDGLCDLD